MFCPAIDTNVACVSATTFASVDRQLRHLRGEVARDGERAVVAVLHAIADERAGRLQLAPVAGDRRVDLADAGHRLIDQLADLLEARRVGVDLQVRLPGLVQRQRPARLHVEVAADDVERADVAGRVAIVAVERGARDLEPADRSTAPASACRRPARCPASRRSTRRATVASTSSVPRDGALQSPACRSRPPDRIRRSCRRLDVRRVARHRGVEGELRNRAAEDRRVVQRAARGHVHRLRRRAAAVRGDVAVDRAVRSGRSPAPARRNCSPTRCRSRSATVASARYAMSPPSIVTPAVLPAAMRAPATVDGWKRRSTSVRLKPDTTGALSACRRTGCRR